MKVPRVLVGVLLVIVAISSLMFAAANPSPAQTSSTIYSVATAFRCQTITYWSGQVHPNPIQPGGLCVVVVPPPNGFPSPPQSLQDVPRFLSQFWAWVSYRFYGQFSMTGNSQPTSTVQGTVGETITLSGSIVSISTVSQATQITVQVANANSRFQAGETVQFLVSETTASGRLQVGNNVRVTMQWTGSYWQAVDIELLS